MTITKLQLKGGRELVARLGVLPVKVQKSILRKGLRQGCNVILAGARASAPVKTGAMKRAMKVKSRKSKKGNVTLGVVLGPGNYRGDTFYGAFQEFGWHAGPRRRSLASKARKATASLRASARAARETGEGMALAKRGTRLRSLQERLFRLEGHQQAKSSGDDRKWIEGKHFMEKASTVYGPTAAAIAVNSIRQGVIRAATSGVL